MQTKTVLMETKVRKHFPTLISPPRFVREDLYVLSPCRFTESKEIISAFADGEVKPASPSSSPATHCTPPSLEPLPSNPGPVVDKTSLSNSLPIKANSPPGEGTWGVCLQYVIYLGLFWHVFAPFLINKVINWSCSGEQVMKEIKHKYSLNILVNIYFKGNGSSCSAVIFCILMYGG